MNLLLTLVWVALTGNFQAVNFFFGAALSFLVMRLSQNSVEDRKYFKRVPLAIGFVLYFFYELVKANLQVAVDVIKPRLYIKPGIISYPMTVTSNFEITLLVNVISLTPGTLIIDISNDRKVLYIHAMFIRDREEFIRSIKNGFEKRILAISR